MELNCNICKRVLNGFNFMNSMLYEEKKGSDNTIKPPSSIYFIESSGFVILKLKYQDTNRCSPSLRWTTFFRKMLF